MSPAAIHASRNFLAVVGDAAARSLLLGCFVAASLGALRVKSIEAKLLASRGVLLAALAMPLLVAVCPAIPLPFSVPNLSQGASVTGAQAQQAVAAYRGEAAPAVSATPRADRDPRSTEETASAPAGGRAASTLPTPLPWPALTLAAYLAIAFAFFVRLMIGVQFGKRLEDAARSISDLRAMEIFSAASRAAGLRAIPRLAESDLLSVPLMLGVREPVILLPSDWRKWDAEKLAAVLDHELSHVKRSDALIKRLALLHRAIFWFSPLAWWLESHLAELSERASDEAALAGGADRTRYAETLLGFFAELEARPERAWWPGVSMAKAGQAEKRVERILAWRNAMSNKMSNKLTKAFMVGLAICAVPVVALTASLDPSFYNLPRLAAPQPPAPLELTQSADQTAGPARTAEPHRVIAPLPPEPPVAEGPAAPVIAAVQQPPPPPRAIPTTQEENSFGNEGRSVGSDWFWGPRFVIVTPGSEPFVMSGSEEDAEHAKSLRDKIPGDFLWFERDEKSYVIRDRATVDRAKKLWATRGDFARDQEALRKKQEALGQQIREEVQQKMNELRVKVPDLTAELQKLQSEVKDLHASGATLQQLGELEREVGELERELGESRSQVGNQMNDLGRRAGDFGRQMGELGRQEGEMARQAVERARQAADEMKQLLDDAIAKGLAKPE
jgi:beta-lactamase regulating signal transducer with metallopeptidase domain